MELIELRKRFELAYNELKRKVENRELVLVERVPISNSGSFKDDKHYITPEALNISIAGILGGN